MSGRGLRKRGRPPKTPNERSTSSRFNYQLLKKPKYLSKTLESQTSTPAASRASSPPESDFGASGSAAATARGRRGANSTNNAASRRGGRGRGKAQATASARKAKSYESEYHYGSDFGDSDDDNEMEPEDDLMLSPSDEESMDVDNDAEDTASEFSVSSFTQNGAGRPARPPSPEPVWLQEGRSYAALELPESSQDLYVPNEHAMAALGIYEILRRFRHLVRLSPFRFEDFCAALVSRDQSALLTEVHIMLLRVILREEDSQATHFAPLDQKDTANISLYLIDPMTWPEVLRSYVESDRSFDRDVLAILSNGEYPYKSTKDRLAVLQFLTDQFLISTGVRDLMAQEGPLRYDDHCRVCHRLGDLLCCETCPAVYHLECVDPPLADVPNDDWQCNLCTAQRVSGVTDCVTPQERQTALIRHEPLGYDRHGRVYWFIARRIFIEDTEVAGNVWYYSTSGKFQLLLERLDSNELESRLLARLNERKEEIMEHMKLTETITEEHKGNRKSVLEQEVEACRDLLDADSSEQAADANDPLKDTTIAEATADEKAPLANNSNNGNNMLTRQKTTQLNRGTFYFKLGMENSYKSYVNQYSVNQIALNKPQRNEDRDKRRHLSHKFSLTAASDFKWSGATIGSMDTMIATLRNTITLLEQSISNPFMNPNWIVTKRVATAALQNCRRAEDFANILIFLQASIKQVVYANVWHEQLGHIRLHRITANEREDRKKREKREKRERDDEEERKRYNNNTIKYSFGLKHYIWKMKGEEYRVHGQWSWTWRSQNDMHAVVAKSCKKFSQASHVIKPLKECVHYSQDSGKTSSVIAVRPRTKQFLKQCETDRQNGNTFHYYMKEQPPMTVNKLHKQDGEKFDGIVDVSKALTKPARVLYPQLAGKSRLNDLLGRRVRLSELEIELSKRPAEQAPLMPPSTAKKDAGSAAHYGNVSFLEKRLLQLGDKEKKLAVAASSSSIDFDIVNAIGTKISATRVVLSELNRFAKSTKCYKRGCNVDSNSVAEITKVTCYSPLCLQKGRTKQELLALLRYAHSSGTQINEAVKNFTVGVRNRPSMLEQALTDNVPDAVTYMPFLNCDNLLQTDEEPYDMLGEIAEARKNAIAYDEESLVKDCIFSEDDIVTGDIDQNTKVKEEHGTEAEDASKIEYMESSMDVCSNVEIESTTAEETTPLVEPPTAAAETATPATPALTVANGFKKRNAKGGRKTYIGTKDMLDVTLDKDIPLSKQNRRFPITPRPPKREDVTKYEREFFENGRERYYSVQSPCGRVYLVRDVSTLYEAYNDKVNVKEKLVVKRMPPSMYPLVSHFRTRTQKRSLFVLPSHELRKIARTAGRTRANGFHHTAKKNLTAWPYPCPRPLFRLCWAYRTLNATSLAAIALQLRTLWTCLRWDDMIAKPATLDGKHQITTETEIVTLELLRLQHAGRYNEVTTYLRRKVLIPMKIPKTIREVTSIRVGLRKRKRAESPQPTEPQISEEWVGEDKLELWEIKLFGEKQEKARLCATTRSVASRQTETNCKSPAPSNGTPIHNRSINVAKPTPTSTPTATDEHKDRTEGGPPPSKVQRLLTARKATESPISRETANNSPSTSIGQTRRVVVRNPDGTTRFIKQTVVKNCAPVNGAAAASTSSPSTVVVARQNNNNNEPSSSPAIKPNSHVIQVIRGADGKLVSRGLASNQRLIQYHDGTLNVLTVASDGSKVISKLPVTGPSIQTQAGTTVTKKVIVQNRPTGVSTPLRKVLPVSQLRSKLVANQLQQTTSTSSWSQANSSSGASSSSNGNIASGVQQKIVMTSNAQAAPTPSTQKVLTIGQPGQSITLQPGQKFLVGNKLMVVNDDGTCSPASATTTQIAVAQPQQQQIQVQPQARSAVILNQVKANAIQAQPQHMQQTRCFTNQGPNQQTIILGNRRIVINPGERFVTQSTMQPVQQQNIQVAPGQRIVQQFIVQPQITQTIKQATSVAAPAPQAPTPAPAVVEQPVQQRNTVVAPHEIAQQLASGKLQVAVVNGIQMIIRPINNNQGQIVAQVKTQSDGSTHIVANASFYNGETSAVAAQPATVQQSQVVEDEGGEEEPEEQHADDGNAELMEQAAEQNETEQNDADAAELQKVIDSQPPGTTVKAVTAELKETEDGMRFVLSGLSSAEFTQEQYEVIHQQIRDQMISTGSTGPLKVYISCPSQPATVAANKTQPPPLAPVHQQQHIRQQQQQQHQIRQQHLLQQQQQQQQLDTQNQASSKGNNDNDANNITTNNNTNITTTTTSTRNSADNNININVGIDSNANVSGDERVTAAYGDGDADNTQIAAATTTATSAVAADSTTHIVENVGSSSSSSAGANINNTTINSTTTTTAATFADQTAADSDCSSTSAPNAAAEVISSSNSTIGSGLHINNAQEQFEIITSTTAAAKNKARQSSLTAETTQIINSKDGRILRLVPATKQTSKIVPTATANGSNAIVVRAKPTVVGSGQQVRLSTIRNNAQLSSSTRTGGQSERKVNRVLPEKQTSITTLIRNASPLSPSKAAELNRHKEALKKSILNKRCMLERTLQSEIQEEVAAELAPKAAPAKVVIEKREPNSTTQKLPTTTTTSSTATATEVAAEKPSSVQQKTESPREPRRNMRYTGNLKPMKHQGVGRPRKSGRRKDEELYCICQTPYDDTKFYVGCDVCKKWFHGDCVNISEEESKNIAEYVCDACKKKRESQPLYCSCRQPYDESQFYICCDKCQDWYHGRCVGIAQKEAEEIDEYICPACQRNTDNSNSSANMQQLTDDHLQSLKVLIKQIKAQKSAWPFMEPVDPKEAPNYYEVIKEPMDLQKIEERINSNKYNTLAEFIGDMTKIFDNCRYYNPKGTSFYKCADTLESFFVQKIKTIRESIAGGQQK